MCTQNYSSVSDSERRLNDKVRPSPQLNADKQNCSRTWGIMLPGFCRGDERAMAIADAFSTTVRTCSAAVQAAGDAFAGAPKRVSA
jgi:hypothetical protein